MHSIDEREQVDCKHPPCDDKIFERRHYNSQPQSIVERTLPNNDKALWACFYTFAPCMVCGKSHFETRKEELEEFDD